MSIGHVTEYTGETVGMISARRWSEYSTPVLAGAIGAASGWEMALLYLAVVWAIRMEVKRVRVAVWAECYNAMRWIMDEHGFKLDGEPQIYANESEHDRRTKRLSEIARGVAISKQ